jgi:hypothetical protein
MRLSVGLTKPPFGARRHRIVSRSTLHGDERRAGKTAKLLDLYARLNLGAL